LKTRIESSGHVPRFKIDTTISDVVFQHLSYLSVYNNFLRSLLDVVQTGSGAHPASYTIGTDALFPGVKRPRREADHSPPVSAEVKNTWVYTSIPPYDFMA
jgi:hypothetical protein